MWAMNDVLIHGAPAAGIRRSWEESRAQFPKDALHMRISDDHDETRAIERYGMNGALAASALMFTLDGVPLLYNGMEVGDATESADPALFDKLNICWQPHQSERPAFQSIYHDLIQLRKRNPAFRPPTCNGCIIPAKPRWSPTCAPTTRMHSWWPSIFPTGRSTAR